MHDAGQGGLAPRLPRHLRGRPAQPGPADPLRDPQRARRRRRRALLRALDRHGGAAAGQRACRCSRVDTHRPAGDFDVSPSTSRPSSSTPTSSTASTSPACPCAPPTAADEHPLVVRRRPLHVQPRAAGRLRRLLRDRRRRRGRRRDHRGRRATGSRRAHRGRASVLRALGHVAGRLRAVDVRRRLRRPPRSSSSRRRYADVPDAGREAHDRRPRRVALPEAAARAAHRGRARPAQRRDLPRLHARLPLLPGGHDHPPGARAPGRAGAHRWCSDGLRRTGYDEVTPHLAVERRLSRHRRRRRRHHQRPGELAARCRVAAQPARRRLHRRHRRPRSRRCAAPGSRSPPKAAPGACAR